MAGTAQASPVDRAEAHLAAGRWSDAFLLLRQADEGDRLTPDGLDVLARAAYGAGELEAAISAWERAHAQLVAEGRHAEAATPAANVAMYLMMETGLMAPVRGWLARAERLLDGEDEAPIHAILAMVRTYERVMCGELEQARAWAERTIELGARHDVAAATVIGRVAAARLRILDGEVETGLRLLDEAAVVTMSGELDALATGIVYCELVCAMQGLAQYDRVQQWTEAMDRWRRDVAFGSFNGRCRVHRAELLRLRGSCAEAEEEALAACDELRPWMRREFGWPLTELGNIRLRRGDLAGAEEAFLGAHANGWDPQPGLARLRLAQGDVEVAADMLADALAHPVTIPSKERPPNEPLRRAPLLDADVEVALAAGRPDEARTAAAELAAIASTYRSAALTAVAALAHGRVALFDGDVDTAVGACETAVAAWCEIGAPYEVAVARTVLAHAYRADGRADQAALEDRLAHDALERVGAAAPSVGDHDVADGSRATSTVATFRRDGDTREISFAGTDVRLQDLKGFRYLERLLAQPGRELHVLDLVAGERPDGRDGVGAVAREDDLAVGSGGADLGPALDQEAKAAYRRRLADIDEDIEDAKRLGDLGRLELAEADRDFIVTELASAFGLHGRHRAVGSSAERARTSVTRALRYAIARVAEHHPALADHLDLTVSTGTYCRYAPDPRAPTEWRR